MEILCTRPGCGNPRNQFSDLDDPTHLKTTQQKYCTACGMHLILGGRYLVSKLLGQGGFGAAFLARDRYTPTMRKCVVKQFQPMGKLDDDQLALAQELFEREAHVLEKIGNRHKQIPDLFAFFPLIVPNASQPGNAQYFYLVQEYIQGEDLEQELKRKGKFTEAEVLEIIISMLGVLDFVHSEGTIHRDIKPSNIMRRNDGLLYLLDFGAVKEVATAAGNISQRSTGIYSPGYAPPEQMRGAQVFPATDLYALAVTCIVLLTGESPESLFDAYSNSWQWSRLANVSPTLEAILNEMLQTTPGDRPKSAQEVLDKLKPKQSAPAPSPAVNSPINTYIQPAPPSVFPTPLRSQSAKKSAAQPAANPPVRAPRKNSTPAATPLAVPGKIKKSSSSPSTSQSLASAAFVGCEGTFLYFIITSFVGGNIAIGIWGAMVAWLIFASIRQSIPSGLGFLLGIVTFVIPAFLGISPLTMIIPAVLASAACVAVFSLFTLIYRVLQKIF